MNEALKILAQICENYRFEEKLLFVPSHSVGHQIREQLAKNDHFWINLKVTTTTRFAQELSYLDLAKQGTRLIDSLETLFIIEKLFLDEDELGKPGCYFEGAAEVPGIIKALSKALIETRMSGIDPNEVDPKAFIFSEKGVEFTRLLHKYDQFLHENALIDAPGLIKKAIAKLKMNDTLLKDRLLMALSDFPLADIEKELIHLAGKEKITIIGHQKPIGLNFPQRYLKARPPRETDTLKPKSNIELLPWLFQPEKAPSPFPDDTVSLYHALGESNEIREVIRRILKEKTPLDDVELIVAQADPYISMIYEICSSLNVSVTVADGVPISYTRPGRALILYCKWLAEDFRSSQLRRLFSGGYLDLEGFDSAKEKPSPGMAARIIREAGIGWDRNRYSERLMALKESYQLRVNEKRQENETEAANRAENMVKQIEWLARFIDEILSTIPRTDLEGQISINALCAGTVDFLQKFCRVAGELDAAAKTVLLETLGSLSRAPSLNYPIKDSGERLAKTISAVRAGHSTPKPGHVHVANYHSGGYSGRHYTYILGLDQSGFPGTLFQDPVLLDVERRKIGSQMIVSGERLEENLYSMAKMLCSLQGKVTLSYSCRDLAEDRERHPCSLMLYIYRLITPDRTGDYRSLNNYLGEPCGFIPISNGVPINDWEWWLGNKDVRYGANSVHAAYSNLYEGERAEIRRAEDFLTEFDGWIPSAIGTMDPLMGELVLSSTQLENLAKCPFAYFLRYMLGIEPLEEMEKDEGKWLDPLQRGELLHEVFYKFMETLKARGDSPEFEHHYPLLETIAMDEVKQWKDKTPPPNDFVFDQEVEDIKQTLEIFLKDEMQRCKTVEPHFFELSFGMAKADESGISTIDPLEINLTPGKRFKIRGRIDRIDRCGNHQYEVWDYKTGSTWGFKDEGYLNMGRHLQHAIYSVAGEILMRRKLDKKAQVVRAGYFFPSAKGEGRRILKNQQERQELYEVLEDLFELLRSGVFPASQDQNACGEFCDYKSICGGKELAVGRVLRKLETDEKLDPLRRLKIHA